jgi:osmotically-inducible protein OsmY
MKILKSVVMTCSLLLAAGCADKQKNAHYADYPPTYSSSEAGTSAGGATSPSGTSSSWSTTSSAGSGQSSDDSALIVQVRRALVQNENVSAVVPTIQISASSGTITLSGSVPSDAQKQNIETIVRQTAGVTSVDNQLQVSSSAAASSSSDSANDQSTGNTSQESTLNPTSNNSQSDASSTNQMDSSSEQLGQASSSNQLSATSGRSSQSNESTPSSGQTGGINVTVQGTSQSDHILAQQIEQELQSETSLGGIGSQVQISLNNGIVTLRGSAKSEQQKRQIESTIQRVAGISSVDDQLQVSSSQPQPSSQ